ncbi:MULTISPECIES: hypothetical protein [Protofrankia]|nr:MULTISPECIES: hypothetical protein [Protofrankia]
MSEVDILRARADALQDSLDEADRYARECRAVAARLRAPLDRLSDVTIDVRGMRSKSARIDRARTRAESARNAVGSARANVSDMVDELQNIARRYERKADAARADLTVATSRLAMAVTKQSVVGP